MQRNVGTGIRSSGYGDGGEAFLVPDGWVLPGAQSGPALNNMSAQKRRFEQSSERTLTTIFAPDSAELMLVPLKDALNGTLLMHREFQYHEAGHAAGMGFLILRLFLCR